MIRPILQFPHPALLKPCDDVRPGDSAFIEELDALIESHYAQENCAGLAAPQIGISKRFVIIDFSEKKDKPLVLVNPVITYASQDLDVEVEGCMSIKGVQAKVRRPAVISVKANDHNGDEFIMSHVDGFMARCIQHEVDHLDGRLFWDHLSTLKKSLLMNQFKRRYG